MRKCGSCDACCTVMGVDDLDKAAGTRCEHLKGHANATRCCTIYSERPEACDVFKCGWLAGIGPSSLRPDRSGLMFTSNYIPDGVGGGRFQFQVYRLRREWSQQAKDVINKLSERGVVIHVDGDNRTILGGPHKDIRWMLKKIDEAKEKGLVKEDGS